MAGIRQSTVCNLAPKGQSGSNCTLDLTITANDLPPNGIHGGPVLCQALADGAPNPLLCYQPSAANSLNITKTTAQAGLSISGSPLILFPSYPTTTGIMRSITVTNNDANLTAMNVAALLPPDWADVTQDASDCLSIAPGASCVLAFTAGSSNHAAITTSVSGSNTNPVSINLAVNYPWVTNGSVSAFALDNAHNKIYLGGQFTYIGPNTGVGAPLDSATGAVLAKFPRVNGSIFVVIPDGTGGWYIGGTFSQVDGVTRNRIAHILSDYTLDPNFDANAGSNVRALILSGSTLYVGGDFGTIGNATRFRLAALDAATGNALPGFVADADNRVYVLILSGGTLYAGGDFTDIQGVSRSRLAALDASTGAVLPGFAPVVDNRVSALLLDGTTLYVGGSFDNINGTPRNRIAALDVNTANLLPFNPIVAGGVNTLVMSGNILYIGGIFSSVGGIARANLAAWDVTNNILVAGFTPNPNNTVASLLINGSTLYVGGAFTVISGQTQIRIAALNAANGALLPGFNRGASGTVSSLALDGTSLYAGGSFSSIGGVPRDNIAAIDTITGEGVLGFNPGANNVVRCMAFEGGVLYFGGDFLNVGGQPRAYIAAWDTLSNSITAFNPSANQPLFALAVGSSAIYAGGRLYQYWRSGSQLPCRLR